jgi:carboxypeptidase Q
VKHQRLMATIVACAVAVMGLYAQATEKIDYQLLTKVRDEGLNRSQAMELESWMADVYGPRITGSPGYKQAADWAMKKMTDL